MDYRGIANEMVTDGWLIGVLENAGLVLYSRRFVFGCGLVLRDVSGDRARGYSVGTGKIHLPRSAASGEVTILRADHDLVGTSRDSRSRIDTSSAAGFNYSRAGFLKNVEITLAHAVLSRLLRAELDVELN